MVDAGDDGLRFGFNNQTATRTDVLQHHARLNRRDAQRQTLECPLLSRVGTARHEGNSREANEGWSRLDGETTDEVERGNAIPQDGDETERNGERPVNDTDDDATAQAELLKRK